MNYYCFLISCDSNQSPNLYLDLGTNPTTAVNTYNSLSSGSGYMKYNGNCFALDTTAGLQFGTVPTPNEVWDPTKYVLESSCSSCTPDNPVTKKIYKLEPCDTASSFSTIYTEDTVEDANYNFDNASGFMFYRGECWQVSSAPNYTGSVLSWEVKTVNGRTSVYIDGYAVGNTVDDFKPIYASCQACIDAYTQSPPGGTTTYKLTPCNPNDGSIIYTQDDLTSLTDTIQGKYKIVEIGGICYEIEEVTQFETPVALGSITNSYPYTDGCIACKNTYYEFQECGNPTNKVYSKWSKEWEDALDAYGDGGYVVKLQDEGSTCWSLYSTGNTSATTVKKRNGAPFEDCSACNAATLDMYKLTKCSDGTIEYTQLDLSAYVSLVIKKDSDDSCWTVADHTPAGGESVIDYEVTDFYNNNGALLYWNTCTECGNYTDQFKLTKCDDTSQVIYSNSYNELFPFNGKIVSLVSISGCWTVELCPTCSSSLPYQNVVVKDSYALGTIGCQTCSQTKCYKLTNVCNGQVKYANNTAFANYVNKEILLDDNGNGDFTDRYLVESIVTTGTECDDASAVNYIDPGDSTILAHTLVDCAYGKEIQSLSSSFDASNVGDILKVVNAGGNPITVFVTETDENGNVVEVQKEIACFRYIGKTPASRCIQNVTLESTVVGTCVDCLVEVDGGDGKIDDSTIENCVQFPTLNECGNYTLNPPCDENDGNYYVTVTRRADSLKDETIILSNKWSVFNFGGFENVPWKSMRFYVQDQVDVFNNNAVIQFEKMKMNIPFLGGLKIDFTTGGDKVYDYIVQEINKRAFITGIRAAYLLYSDTTIVSSPSLGSKTLRRAEFDLFLFADKSFVDNGAIANGYNFNVTIKDVKGNGTLALLYNNVLTTFGSNASGNTNFTAQSTYNVDLNGQVNVVGDPERFDFELIENGIYDVKVYNPWRNATHLFTLYVDCFDSEVFDNVFYQAGLTKVECNLFAFGREEEDAEDSVFKVTIEGLDNDYLNENRYWDESELSFWFRAPQDGIYKLTFTRVSDGLVRVYNVMSYCATEKCFDELIDDIMCGKINYCDDCADLSEFKSDIRLHTFKNKHDDLQKVNKTSLGEKALDVFKKLLDMIGVCFDCEDDVNDKPCKNC